MRALPPEGHRLRSIGRVPESACPVVLWDERRDRLQEITKILNSGGFQQAVIEKSSDSRLIPLSAKCFVAVASTGDAASGIGMDVIQNLKAKGFKVIAYEDGADSWPIRTKCLPLLAGAIQLYDGSKAEFSQKLRDTVERIVLVETERRNDEDNVKAVMRDLGLIGESNAMMTVFRTIIRFSALSDLPVIIVGETGTGKEALACALLPHPWVNHEKIPRLEESAHVIIRVFGAIKHKHVTKSSYAQTTFVQQTQAGLQ